MGTLDSTSRSVRTQCDWSTTEPTVAIVEAIATLENVELVDMPGSLDVTLVEHINPDALEKLVTEETSISISFAVDEYFVRIDDDRLVVRQK